MYLDTLKRVKKAQKPSVTEKLLRKRFSVSFFKSNRFLAPDSRGKIKRSYALQHSCNPPAKATLSFRNDQETNRFLQISSSNFFVQSGLSDFLNVSKVKCDNLMGELKSWCVQTGGNVMIRFSCPINKAR
ncbi:hypothetical protein P5673_018438 [Acropora cervicornis]|uniref:Uncharacterized protein n=1 Tax=Acropora cervicornis TaxID=6130 RepID=A0AAD9QDB2_ACRCE|nr:hypothetical protein P5673_018438 [Acropora cervicornis]